MTELQTQYQHPLDKMGWTIVYHAITLDRRIHHGAFRLYLLIHKYAQQRGYAWPSRSTLANELGVSEDTIWRWMRKLEEVGLIERRKECFIGTTTIYVLDPHDTYFKKYDEERAGATFVEHEERVHATFVEPEEHATIFVEHEERAGATFVEHEERVHATPKNALARHEEIIIEQEGGGEKEPVKEKIESDLAQAIANALEEAGVFSNTAKILGKQMASEGITPEEALEIWQETLNACRKVRPRGRQLSDEEVVAMAVARVKRGDWRKRAEETIHWAQFSQVHDEQAAIPIFMQSQNGIWERTLKLLELELTQATFSTWLSSSRYIGRDGNTLIIEVSGPAARDWLESRLRGVIERAVARVAGEPLSVKFVVAEG